ncbi:hypothetical protein ACEPPN_019239 [Leptodophora sp. 'Broadleaf-Isolate-01']
MVAHHLLTGSYTNSSLFLLAFDTVAKTLTLNQTIPAFGLHQFVTTNAARDVVYATTMSEPPRLFSWAMSADYKFTHLNTVDITSSSCYFSSDGEYAFSAGGPSARIHKLDSDGGIGGQVDEMLYVPAEDLPNVNKTRSAVLWGAHGIDVNVNKKAFVPHLGWDGIFMYDILANGSSRFLSLNKSPEKHDGPRNVYPSKNGRYLYVINEHSQYLDVYKIGKTILTHKQRASAIPPNVRGQYTYRSNAAQLSRDGKTIFTSTRGWNDAEANGWVAAFALTSEGLLKSEDALTYYQAPLTLGSAGGLRVAFWEDETNNDREGLTDYMYLSDTSLGFMYILGWMPSTKRLSEVARYRYSNASPYEAVWLD